jgi:hypothetical protein
MVSAAHELGYNFQVHDNYRCNYPISPDWDTEHVIQDVHGEPLVQGWWGSGTEYGTWPAALPEAKVGGHLCRLKGLGLKGMAYCDYWFSPLEVNYHPKHRGTRSAHQRGIEKVLAEVKGVFGAIGTEFGSLPACIACDYIAVDVPTGYHNIVKLYPHWPVSNLMDEFAPVWALALQGLVLHPASGGATWSNAMAGVAWGAIPRDEFGVRPARMGGVYLFDDRRAAALKALHDFGVERFGRLAAEEMTRCTLSPDFQQVKTAFADGTEVSADYATKELIVNGTTDREAGRVAGCRIKEIDDRNNERSGYYIPVQTHERADRLLPRVGFIELKNVLSAEALEYYGARITKLILDLDPRRGQRISQRDTYGKAFIQVGNLWLKSHVIKEFVFGKRLARIAAELLEIDGGKTLSRSGTLHRSRRRHHALACRSVLLADGVGPVRHRMGSAPGHAAGDGPGRVRG